MQKSETKQETSVRPVISSILVIIGWLVFIVTYSLYLSKKFNLFQNEVVSIAGVATTALLIGAMWLMWHR